MLELIEPNISHKLQWKEIIEEWGEDWRKNPKIFFQNTYEDLLEIMEKIRNADDFDKAIPKSSLYFLIDNERILGMYWFRHNLIFYDDAENGGNIGYGIRPIERKKGYGKVGLSLVLDKIKQLGFKDVYISCDDDNRGSIKIIEANGGRLEKFSLRHGTKGRRYLI